MWPHSYWASSYWATSYWAPVAPTPAPTPEEPSRRLPGLEESVGVKGGYLVRPDQMFVSPVSVQWLPGTDPVPRKRKDEDDEEIAEILAFFLD